MNRAELLILWYAVDGSTPIAWLLPPDEAALVLNKPSHDLEERDLTAVLCRMLDRGWLRLTCDKPPASGMTSRQLIEFGYTRDTIPGPTEEVPYFAVTESGGAEWSRWFRPDWSRYIAEWTDVIGLTGLARCADEHHLRQFFETACSLRSAPAADSDSAVWKSITPWHATDWKTLPTGHEVTYRLMGDFDDGFYPDWDCSDGPWCPAQKRIFELREWYRPWREVEEDL